LLIKKQNQTKALHISEQRVSKAKGKNGFNALCFKAKQQKWGKVKSGSPKTAASFALNQTRRSGRSPALPYPP
jgi:hypothetical protein